MNLQNSTKKAQDGRPRTSPRTEEEKAKISKALKKYYSTHKGKAPGWPKGKKKAEKSKIRLSRSLRTYYSTHKRVGIPHSIRNKIKISIGIERSHRRKMRGQVTINTNPILEYSDIYNYSRAVDRISRRSCPQVRKYLNERSLEVKPGTLKKDAQYLSRALKSLPTPNKVKKNDIINFLAKEKERGISEGTLGCYKTALRMFFNWAGKPKLVDWFKYSFPMRRDKYTTLADVKRFIRNCETLEERAFFSLLWEGNFRAGELLQVTREDIDFSRGFLLVHIKHGKTGERTVPVLRKGNMFPLGSYNLFKQHLKNVHKEKVWSMVAFKQAQYRVRKIKKKAGVPWFHLHLFRKSRFTYNSEMGMNSAIANQFGGWKVNSRVTERYLLASGMFLIPALRKMNVAKHHTNLS